jgi:hypothetical protein
MSSAAPQFDQREVIIGVEVEAYSIAEAIRAAKRYSEGLERLLNGNSIYDFAEALHVKLPSVEPV